jgi:hypothetical protein
MNKQAQQIAIAKACGIVTSDQWGPLYRTAFGLVRDCPDYLTDLNAMYEAEKLIMDESSIIYFEWLTRLSCPWHATAPQRAEAFLRTLNLWKE